MRIVDPHAAFRICLPSVGARLIAAIALALLCPALRLPLPVLWERPARVLLLGELALFVTPHEALLAFLGLDPFSFLRHQFLRLKGWRSAARRVPSAAGDAMN